MESKHPVTGDLEPNSDLLFQATKQRKNMKTLGRKILGIEGEGEE